MTPRTGDRVLVSAGAASSISDKIGHIPSTTGVVLDVYEDGHGAVVRVDGLGAVNMQFDRLTVLDRDPIQWPTYVTHKATSARWLHDAMGVTTDHEMVAYTAADARRNADAWTYVADHYDELRRT